MDYFSTVDHQTGFLSFQIYGLLLWLVKKHWIFNGICFLIAGFMFVFPLSAIFFNISIFTIGITLYVGISLQGVASPWLLICVFVDIVSSPWLNIQNFWMWIRSILDICLISSFKIPPLIKSTLTTPIGAVFMGDNFRVSQDTVMKLAQEVVYGVDSKSFLRLRFVLEHLKFLL